MTDVQCKLTDCSKYIKGKCISKSISIDGVGLCEIYDPIKKSSIVYDSFRSNCQKSGGKYKSSRVTGILK